MRDIKYCASLFNRINHENRSSNLVDLKDRLAKPPTTPERGQDHLGDLSFDITSSSTLFEDEEAASESLEKEQERLESETLDDVKENVPEVAPISAVPETADVNRVGGRSLDDAEEAIGSSPQQSEEVSPMQEQGQIGKELIAITSQNQASEETSTEREGAESQLIPSKAGTISRQNASQDVHTPDENDSGETSALSNRRSEQAIKYTIGGINIELSGDEQSMAELAEIEQNTIMSEKRVLRYLQKLKEAKLERMMCIGELTKQAAIREEQENRRLKARIAEEKAAAANEANADISRKRKRQVTFREDGIHPPPSQHESQLSEVPFSPESMQSPLYPNQREDNQMINRPGNITPMQINTLPAPRMRNGLNTAASLPR